MTKCNEIKEIKCTCGWIEIEKEKPIKSQIVLIATNKEVIVGYFHLNKEPAFTDYLNGFPINGDIRFWMALPCSPLCSEDRKCFGCLLMQAYEEGVREGFGYGIDHCKKLIRMGREIE